MKTFEGYLFIIMRCNHLGNQIQIMTGSLLQIIIVIQFFFFLIQLDKVLFWGVVVKRMITPNNTFILFPFEQMHY